MRAAIKPLERYIVTPRHSEHRLFSWVPSILIPDDALFAIATDNDTIFGVLHSRYHEIWTLRTCTWVGTGNDARYTTKTCFDTFPFPDGCAPTNKKIKPTNLTAEIAKSAKSLDRLRLNWLHPAELTKTIPEVVSGYPDRPVPVDDKAEFALKPRTLTNLYNEKPWWLVTAHQELDQAVAAAYGWDNSMTDDEVFAELWKLNYKRAQNNT